MDIKNIRTFFPWFKNNPGLIYFDTAATSLKPQCVIDKINYYYTHQSTNPHNTDSIFCHSIYQDVENARSTIANFINANANEIAFNSGATEGINLVANAIRSIIKPNDEIVLTYGEHASNLLPWINLANELNIKIKYIGSKNNYISVEDFKNALSPKTKLVAFANRFNLTGYRLNETEITNAIKDYNPNILVLIDATQSIQHSQVDVQKTKCDFLVFSGHKLFGPTGIGVLYIKQNLQNFIKPLRNGGGMNFSIDESSYELIDNVHKYEGGTQNIAGILGLAAAVQFLQSIGYEQIQAHEKELSSYAIKKLSSIKQIIIYNSSYDSPIISFNYEGVFSQDLANYLGSKNIIVRSGLSCAKLYCKLIDTSSLVRISLYVYNTKEEIDKLFEVLKNFKRGDELNGII